IGIALQDGTFGEEDFMGGPAAKKANDFIEEEGGWEDLWAYCGGDPVLNGPTHSGPTESGHEYNHAFDSAEGTDLKGAKFRAGDRVRYNGEESSLTKHRPSPPDISEEGRVTQQRSDLADGKVYLVDFDTTQGLFFEHELS